MRGATTLVSGLARTATADKPARARGPEQDQPGQGHLHARQGCSHQIRLEDQQAGGGPCHPPIPVLLRHDPVDQETGEKNGEEAEHLHREDDSGGGPTQEMDRGQAEGP